MLFARFDWFLYGGISSSIHLLAASGGKNAARDPFHQKISNSLGIAIKFVLYTLKQLFASVSVNSGGYLPRRSGSVNIHHYSPPLRRIIVKYCFSIIIQHKFNSNSQLLILFSSKMGFVCYFFSSGSRQEVNSTCYSKIEEPIQSCKKHYSLVLYIRNVNYSERAK